MDTHSSRCASVLFDKTTIKRTVNTDLFQTINIRRKEPAEFKTVIVKKNKLYVQLKLRKTKCIVSLLKKEFEHYYVVRGFYVQHSSLFHILLFIKTV